MRRLILSLALLSLLAAAPAAQARTETASSGDVTATLTYQGHQPTYRPAHLTITQSGLTLFDAAVKMPCKFCGLVRVSNHKVMRVRDLDGDAEPEVLLSAFSGGAHCCVYALVYRFLAFDNTYQRVPWAFGDPGYTLRDLNKDKRPEFVSGDQRFTDAFTSHAASAEPIAIYQFGQKGFTEVTRKFRKAVRAHARRMFRFYRRALREPRDSRDVRGVLAAYVGDEYLAGHGKHGLAVLRRAARRGQLGSPPETGFGPTGKRYVRTLKRYLRRWGYTKK
jgi:hypothetical protein